MPSLHLYYLRQLNRLRKETEWGYEWLPHACISILDFCYKLNDEIEAAGEEGDTDTFLEALATYQELVVVGVQASLAHPELAEQQEFVDAVEQFVTEVIYDVQQRQLYTISPMEFDLINLLLETTWNSLHVLRHGPPPT